MLQRGRATRARRTGLSWRPSASQSSFNGAEPRGPGERRRGYLPDIRCGLASTGPSHEGPENGRLIASHVAHVWLQRGRATRARRTLVRLPISRQSHRASTGPSHEGPENIASEMNVLRRSWLQRGRATRARRTASALRRVARPGCFNGAEPRGPGELRDRAVGGCLNQASTGPSHEGPENASSSRTPTLSPSSLQRGRATRARRTWSAMASCTRSVGFNGAEPRGPGEP